MSGLSGIGRPTPPPGSTQQRIDEVVAKLKARGAISDFCPRCGVFDWSVDFFQIPVSPMLAGTYLLMGPQSGLIPAVCFVCKNCGYMMFHNLNVLEKTG
jgi:hypothetical protein